MKITVWMRSDTVVICSKCKWSGCIDLANWMQEVEFGYCPKCGSAEFDDLDSWEQVDYDNQVHDHPSIACLSEWTWTGWKARIAVYALLAVLLIFGVFPWAWGLVNISNAIIKKFGFGI